MIGCPPRPTETEPKSFLAIDDAKRPSCTGAHGLGRTHTLKALAISSTVAHSEASSGSRIPYTIDEEWPNLAPRWMIDETR